MKIHLNIEVEMDETRTIHGMRLEGPLTDPQICMLILRTVAQRIKDGPPKQSRVILTNEQAVTLPPQEIMRLLSPSPAPPG